MRRPPLVLLAAVLAGTVAAAPAETSREAADDVTAPAGATVEEGTFPIGVCAWARPVSSEKFCVIVNDPRPWLP